jgi:ectoine hydroxylase-related dioxygenase (phytanoyl-CoA dioxygenase family)
MEKSYGVTSQRTIEDIAEFHQEEVTIKGFTIVKDALSAKELTEARTKLDAIYAELAAEYGEDNLDNINEKNFIRTPFKSDDFFLHKVALNTQVTDIVNRILGDYYILHLQNAILNKPNEAHHQSSWHRDLPYQNFVISKPLAIGALFCIDEFTLENGCTFAVPFTHKVEMIPSKQYIDANKLPLVAPAGSVIVFDSMLFHQAGYNQSQNMRRAINNVYITPILKQQIDLPKMLGEDYTTDPYIRRFLGYDSAVVGSDDAWRVNRRKKLNIQ